jgi:polygalacturonase
MIVLNGFMLWAQPEWIKETGARRTPAANKVFYANKFGARADSLYNSTAAIQKAIDACAAAGGGTVLLKPGSYKTGALFMRSNVMLQIDKSVILLGSTDFSDYPEIDTRIAGIEMKWPAALINFINADNAALTGDGQINARGKFCWDLYWRMRESYDKKGLRWVVDYDAKRVRTILLQSSRDITISGLTLKNAGFWTVQVLYSSYVSINGLTILNNEDGKGPSTDGIDIDSSSWVKVENCEIDCNDDNFCLKSGRDWDGLRVNRPTEYVYINNCVARRGAGLLTLGSETAGGIRHVYCSNLRAKHTGSGFRIKSATTRGGLLEDIYFVAVTMDSVRDVFQFNLNWYPAYSYSQLPEGYNYDNIPAHWKVLLHKVEPAERGIPHARDIHISDVIATHARKAIVALGLPGSLLERFSFSNCHIESASFGDMQYCADWLWDNWNISLGGK